MSSRVFREESRHAEADSDSGSRDDSQVVEEGMDGGTDRRSSGVGSADRAAVDRPVFRRRGVGHSAFLSNGSATTLFGPSSSTKDGQETETGTSGVGVGVDSCVSGAGGRSSGGGAHDSALAVRRTGRRAAGATAGRDRSGRAPAPGVADGRLGGNAAGERPARELAAARR